MGSVAKAPTSVLRVESFSTDALVLRHDCFKTDGDAYIYTVNGKDVAHGLWFLAICLMPIFVGVRW